MLIVKLPVEGVNLIMLGLIPEEVSSVRVQVTGQKLYVCAMVGTATEATAGCRSMYLIS